jgi:hypothetical protein
VPTKQPVALLLTRFSGAGLTPAFRGEAAMLAYNVFRTRGNDVYCVVPEDRPVPAFVSSEAWEFSGKSTEDLTARLPKAANVALRFNGYYIFHPFQRPKLAA